MCPAKVTAGSFGTLLGGTQVQFFPPSPRQPTFPILKINVKATGWLKSCRGALRRTESSAGVNLKNQILDSMYISINNIYHSLGGEMRQKNERPERDCIPDEAEG